MSLGDKIKNAAEELKGKAEEAAGKVTDNPDLVAKGKNEQSAADVKQAGEHLKEGDFKAAGESTKDAFDN